MIHLEGICKTFRIARRQAGFSQAAKALFRREYALVHALRDVSFSVSKGEMVGYIGPNGAGKSSTIKIMSGILTPDRGKCQINGLTPWEQRRRHTASIGVVFGQRSQLWWDVPVADSFLLLRDIYRMDKDTFKKSQDELVTLFQLSEIIQTPARQLSLGQRMRCEIAASLLHRPEILFLDEPTIGLDAVSKIAVRNFIKQINKERGTTVILTTHDMQDIEALTERIILIGKGRILKDGSLADLKKHCSSFKTLAVEYSEGDPVSDAYIANLPGLSLQSAVAGRAVFTLDTQTLSVSSAVTALSQRAELTDLTITGATAEEMVVSLYKEYQI